ncbi:MAG TPA: sigma-70 family RNA polymerase sigma factor, partial [Bryobacteraceae bacterium]|nr:sigma-70 family RNA polymerase sigma factor [Bryobacteraceae bacterium]
MFVAVDACTSAVVDHLFRRQSGKMIATLTRIFGSRRLDLAEEVVEDALVKALELWPFQGIPENPSAWLIQVAKHRALDLIRRETSLTEKLPDLARAFLEISPLSGNRDEFDDDQLSMMFLCCHPALSRETRITLTLKSVAGFSVREIARAFLAEEAAIAQRLVRGKRQIRDQEIQFETPAGLELRARLDSVLEVLCLLFNEGYSAHEGESLLRQDLCEEAIRLSRLVAGHASTGVPKSHALLALLLLQASRLPARVSAEGELFLLRDQDRSLWDRRLIAEGIAELDRSAAGDELTSYHLQAGIAFHHAAAASYAGTDWREIVELYDQLYAMDASPVIALNRAIALSRWKGPEAGIGAIAEIEHHPALAHYHLLPVTLAELWSELGDAKRAAAYYQAALECPCTDPERRL